ncbi:DNA polymerase I [Pseudomonas phage pphageT12]|uniref:DNA polymerase I n=1 Tax=Pseudomonas phage phiB1_1 TaxID=2755402 RepID=A0A7D7IWV9_9CAUD|nr:DNA polymerase I [Pseudomonas phage phiB1_1]UAW53657.1 DNA polymerase I [Pseudomonas phage pphageB21]UAW53716.1 DNA polymerase I [Pseudomonas phage pphageT21]UAW53775.1 DNA polymerase I [Pseudomonas phage pphageT12]
MRIRIADIETQNHPYLGGVASAHCPDNYIVLYGWRDDVDGVPGTPQLIRFESKEEANDPSWFSLDGVDLFVHHNSMYECSWWITRYRDEFLRFLKRGGRVLCTQLGEYLSSHQTWTYPALNEVAQKHGGTPKVDGVKMLWEQGVLTADIDPALLSEYLIGPSGDIENTARAFYGQMQYLNEMGMWRMFLERCEGMVCFAFCEAAGLYVNKEVAERNQAEQLKELAEINEQIEKLLPVLPATFEWNWGSDFHMSALLFGGEVKYQERVPRTDADGNVVYEKQDCYKFGQAYLPIEGMDAESFELACCEFGPCDRYSAGKNKGQLKPHKVLTGTPQTKWADTTFKFPGILPIAAMPKVLAEKFAFDPNARRNGEYVGKRFLPCGTPVYSTSGEVLTALAVHGFEAGKLLNRKATLDKDNGTYYISHEYNADGSIKKTKGMLQYVGPDNIIHHSLNTCATTTGRLSSSNPNL